MVALLLSVVENEEEHQQKNIRRDEDTKATVMTMMNTLIYDRLTFVFMVVPTEVDLLPKEELVLLVSEVLGVREEEQVVAEVDTKAEAEVEGEDAEVEA
jgi:hypothetical protein